MRIVLAEDNDLNREMLRRRLQRHDIEVIEATDGEMAVDVVKLHLPQLVLLDLSMPIIDGWEVAEILSEDPTTRSIPLIALTGHAIDQERERAMQAGCVSVMTKPFDFKELLAEIERYT